MRGSVSSTTSTVNGSHASDAFQFGQTPLRQISNKLAAAVKAPSSTSPPRLAGYGKLQSDRELERAEFEEFLRAPPEAMEVAPAAGEENNNENNENNENEFERDEDDMMPSCAQRVGLSLFSRQDHLLFTFPAFLLCVLILILISVLVCGPLKNTYDGSVWVDSAIWQEDMNDTYCERVAWEDFIRQPADTLSSLAYVFVGIVFVNFMAHDINRDLHRQYRNDDEELEGLLIRHPIWSLAFGICAIFVGVSSFIFHASFTVLGARLDTFSWWVLDTTFICYSWARLFLDGFTPTDKRTEKSFFGCHCQMACSAYAQQVLAAIVALLCVAAKVGIDVALYLYLQALEIRSLSSIVFLGMLAVFLIPIALHWLLRWRDVESLWSMLVLAGVLGSAAFTLNWYDSRKFYLLCDPDSFSQPHAWWHFLSALAVLVTYLFFRGDVGIFKDPVKQPLKNEKRITVTQTPPLQVQKALEETPDPNNFITVSTVGTTVPTLARAGSATNVSQQWQQARLSGTRISDLGQERSIFEQQIPPPPNHIRTLSNSTPPIMPTSFAQPGGRLSGVGSSTSSLSLERQEHIVAAQRNSISYDPRTSQTSGPVVLQRSASQLNVNQRVSGGSASPIVPPVVIPEPLAQPTPRNGSLHQTLQRTSTTSAGYGLQEARERPGSNSSLPGHHTQEEQLAALRSLQQRRSVQSLQRGPSTRGVSIEHEREMAGVGFDSRRVSNGSTETTSSGAHSERIGQTASGTRNASVVEGTIPKKMSALGDLAVASGGAGHSPQGSMSLTERLRVLHEDLLAEERKSTEAENETRPLPQGWMRSKDPGGKTFFFNPQLSLSQYEFPGPS